MVPSVPCAGWGAGQLATKAPGDEYQIEVRLPDGAAVAGLPRGQASQVAAGLVQDGADASLFRGDGKDPSWFSQKGGVTFRCANARKFRLEVQFPISPRSRFGDAYADLSRADQAATINWMLMIGVAREGHELTGYKDCKSSGFYFLLHANYRRTHWRIVGCPHDGAEVEDAAGTRHTCDPQRGCQFELPAYEGQVLAVELADGELWLLDGDCRVLRGHWATDGRLPEADYCPALLTPNCPTEVRATVAERSRPAEPSAVGAGGGPPVLP